MNESDSYKFSSKEFVLLH